MYNKVILIGRLTADPELKQTPNGIATSSFSIAVSRSYTPKGGERQTDFIDIVTWRATAEFVCRYFNKGKLMLVEGTLQVRSFTDKNDQKRRVYEVVADSVHFAESKNSSQGNQAIPTASEQGGQSLPPPAYSSGTVEDFAQIDDDGDLPF